MSMYNSGYNQRDINHDLGVHKNQFNSQLTDFDLDSQHQHSTIHQFETNPMMETVNEEDSYTLNSFQNVQHQLLNYGFLKPLDIRNNSTTSMAYTVDA